MQIINSNLFTNAQLVKNNYQMLATDDEIYVDASGGPVTITLPPVSSIKQNRTPFSIKKIDSTANVVTVASASNVDGAGSYLLNVQNMSVVLATDGNTWWILSRIDGAPGSNSSQDALCVTLSAAQSISITPANVNFDTKELDTQNSFNVSTHIWTPTKSGFYFVSLNLGANVGALTGHADLTAYLVKNASQIAQENTSTTVAADQTFCNLSIILFFNGSSDTLRAQVVTNSGTTANLLAGTESAPPVWCSLNAFFLHS